MLAACSTEYEQPVEKVKTVSSKSFKVSEEEAVQRLEKMLGTFDSATRGKVRTIKEVIPRVKPRTRAYATEIPDTLYYYVNFDDNNGYAIVAADERAIPVLALIDTGNYVPHQSYVSYYNHIVDSLDVLYPQDDDDFWCFQHEATFKTVEMIEDLCDGYISGLGNSPYIKEFKESSTISQVGPYINTKWAQTFPYNARCISNHEDVFSFCEYSHLLDVAGCVSVAISQICAYHQHPNSYNGHTFDWNFITDVRKLKKPQDGNLTTTQYMQLLEVSYLIKAAGHAASVKFGKESSGARVNEAKRAFENYLGYSVNKIYGFKESVIRNELNEGRPVYQSAKPAVIKNGHAWVIDGYRICNIQEIKASYQDDTYSTELQRQVINEYEQYYYHCNYGWEGDADGYYLGKLFCPSQGPEMAEEGEGGERSTVTLDCLFRTLCVTPIK